MGLGDNLMASGFAKGAKARGKKIAFGDGRQIIWDHHSEIIFGKRGTPTENLNVARPGDEDADNLEWVHFYRGNRLYNRQAERKWIWNLDFKAIPGEIFLTPNEKSWARQQGQGFVVIEPNVPRHKSVAQNKQWPTLRYNKVAKLLTKAGMEVVQFHSNRAGHVIPGARQITTPDFRHAMACLARAALYIGAEGGLHHSASAVGISAVVLFGGFIPPSVTGYATHTNLTGGAEACGSIYACAHCAAAMDAIQVPEVMDAAHRHLNKAAA